MVLKIGGVYEHVKTGTRYKLLAVARDSKTLEDVVVYEALYDNNVSKVWARPKESFIGEAMNPDGTIHPRFQLVDDISA